MICVKGATVTEALDKDRLLHPMVRNSLNEPFRQACAVQVVPVVVTMNNYQLQSSEC